MRCEKAWARSEFGHAELGDKRRSARLVQLAAEVAEHPAGTVTAVCRTAASREGAFRLLESRAVRVEAVRTAAETAGARRCAGHSRVIVAVDATSLSLTDVHGGKQLGGVGSWKQGARGVHVMTALASTVGGATLGLCAQRFWTRTGRSTASRRRRRHVDEKTETQFWTETLLGARENLIDQAPDCAPWFQIDRGGDCWEVLRLARQENLLLTVRATHDRRLDESAGYLWETLQRAPVRAVRRVQVAAQPPKAKRKRVGHRRYKHWTSRPQKARIARVEIRAATVSLSLRSCSGHRAGSVEFNAVLVRERSHRGENPIEWMLLTTHPIANRDDALAIVDAYCLRWRVEEFHRTWKRGLCRVEDTQLRSVSAIFKWATILATVATRAMTLSQMSRTKPDIPATDYLTTRELRAIFALRQPKGADPNVVPTLHQAVRWIADLGGYVGPWNGPPGPTVIGRGLHDVLVAARAFEGFEKMR